MEYAVAFLIGEYIVVGMLITVWISRDLARKR